MSDLCLNFLVKTIQAIIKVKTKYSILYQVSVGKIPILANINKLVTLHYTIFVQCLRKQNFIVEFLYIKLLQKDNISQTKQQNI